MNSFTVDAHDLFNFYTLREGWYSTFLSRGKYNLLLILQHLRCPQFEVGYE